MYKGIDVSKWNGNIDWDTVAPNIDFAIIRAGAGKTVDKTARKNLEECEKRGIPYGVYWFSYAGSVENAEKEAGACFNVVKDFSPFMGVFFDFEYASVEYARGKGVKITSELVNDMAVGFCEKIQKLSNFQAGIYTNLDYMNRYWEKETLAKYLIWYARYNSEPGVYGWDMWQYSSVGKIPGIVGKVDLNYSMELRKGGLMTKYFTDLEKLVLEIVQGKYGNGSQRKRALKEKGYDYSFVQSIVNDYLKH